MGDNKARQRIENLLDDYSFVEFGAAVTARSTDFNTSEPKEASDGVITGMGTIDDKLVFVYSQDASVLNGTIGEMHAKKILHVYDKALSMGAPVLGFIDCGGVRLYEAMDGIEAMGQMISAASAASGVIPQVLGICGKCGGALNVLASLNDYVVMSENASLFINSPDTIEGNRRDVLDTSSAAYQFDNGNVDVICEPDEMASLIKNYVDMIPGNNIDENITDDSFDDLNRASDGLEALLGNMKEFISRIADDNILVETKAGISTMVTGLIKLNGKTVGVVANEEFAGNARLTNEGVKKATDFVNFCDAFSIPVITFTNVEGFEADAVSENDLGNSLAKMCLAFSSSDVPKINVLIGKAIGSGYLFMNSSALSADLVYAYPECEMAVMNEDMAAKIICDNKDLDVNEVATEFANTNTGIDNAARRGYVDRIINPVDTRKYLIGGLEMLYSKNDYYSFKKHSAK